mmetsp:Transcript_14300/g.50210  ORF Transcript_14300/g.50210 Transcript_14300/m.50210 type:complete len:227 (-) Transcript_14300:255-935(-)
MHARAQTAHCNPHHTHHTTPHRSNCCSPTVTARPQKDKRTKMDPPPALPRTPRSSPRRIRGALSLPSDGAGRGGGRPRSPACGRRRGRGGRNCRPLRSGIRSRCGRSCTAGTGPCSGSWTPSRKARRGSAPGGRTCQRRAAAASARPQRQRRQCRHRQRRRRRLACHARPGAPSGQRRGCWLTTGGPRRWAARAAARPSEKPPCRYPPSAPAEHTVAGAAAKVSGP